MKDNELKEYKFKPRARLLQLLGDQLIRDARIGVFELVKNAYDADSPTCDVTISFPTSEEDATIEILDYGGGMDLETVQNIWLEPGAEHRKAQREAGIRTPKFHRLPIGEKGVGRFAAHKLGNKIKLITRKEGSNEVVVEIDWDNIANNHKYLDDAPINIIERTPEVFTGKKHGTAIKIAELRNKWTRGEVRKLYSAIISISSAYSENNSFSVNFHLAPDPGDWLAKLLNPKDIIEQSIFNFEFEIGETLSYTYNFKPLPSFAKEKKIPPRVAKIAGIPVQFEYMDYDKDGNRKRYPQKAKIGNYKIGTINGRIYGFDRDKELKSYFLDFAGIGRYLNEHGGVKVYRDGVRVYNYGEPESDWLGLDERRIQVPARRISNNLILGEVHLSLGNSQDLMEKTNREGFVENDAYEHFRYAILSAIAQYEQERAKDKDTIRKAFERDRHDEEIANIDDTDEAINALQVKVEEIKQEKVLGPYLVKIRKTYSEMRETLLGSVGSGLGLAIVFHELERGVRDLARSIDKNAPITKLNDMARHLVDLLEGASYLVKTSSRKSHKASDLVQHSLYPLSLRFEYHNIEILNSFENSNKGDFLVKGAHKMLVASVVNLIDNSIYWLKTSKGKDQKKHIWIGYSDRYDGPAIIVADNGPGFKDDSDDVIKPFFTRKTEGMGLGLYYVNMAMKAHGGRLVFPEKEDIDLPKAVRNGAVVALVFRRQND